MKRGTILQLFSATRQGSSRFYRNGHLCPFTCFSRLYSQEMLPTDRQGQSHPMSDPGFNQHENFFRYTSGRWLWDEEQQLRDRFTPFNVLELQCIAAKSVGANKCVAMTKLAEGSFNKTFRLTMDNGSAVIARLPHPIAGPKYYTTASEVATMDFVSFSPSTVHSATSNASCRLGPYYKYLFLRSIPGAHTSITLSVRSTLSWKKLQEQS